MSVRSGMGGLGALEVGADAVVEVQMDQSVRADLRQRTADGG
jgi:hypothetical protein